MSNHKIGFIGAGNMGGALARAVIEKTGGDTVYVCRTTPERSAETACQLGCRSSTAEEICAFCDVIFIGVKPQALGHLVRNLSPVISKRTDECIFVSMAAGVSLGSLSGLIGEKKKIIRIMPNLPVSTGNGAVLYCSNENVSEDDERAFFGILECAGEVIPLPEKLFDAGTAISGCGPAFVCMFIDALSEGGVRCGLTKETALKLSCLTLSGSAESVIKTGKHPDALRDEVCSPAGSTVAGVAVLEERAFRSAVSDSVAAAFARTKELGKQ